MLKLIQIKSFAPSGMNTACGKRIAKMWMKDTDFSKKGRILRNLSSKPHQEVHF